METGDGSVPPIERHAALYVRGLSSAAHAGLTGFGHAEQVEAQRVATGVGLAALAGLVIGVGLPPLLPPEPVAEIELEEPETPATTPARPADPDDDPADSPGDDPDDSPDDDPADSPTDSPDGEDGDE